jgi:hypothetical protein
LQTENLFNLKIHKLSQEQYDRELVAGTLDEHALYITPDENYTNNFSSVLVGSETISAADSEGILVIGSSDGSVAVGINNATGGIDLSTNTSTVNASGADYAEYFEWLDGNSSNVDRRGYFVTLDGDKIKYAEPGDYVLGIISGLPAIVGNSDKGWSGKYLRDDFGAFIIEEFEYEEKEHDPETGEEKIVIKTGSRLKQNPDYDPEQPYISRADRPEWAAVGMMGVLSVRDDGTCQVNGYCTVAEGGTATASESGYRVIKRVNDHIVKVIFR